MGDRFKVYSIASNNKFTYLDAGAPWWREAMLQWWFEWSQIEQLLKADLYYQLKNDLELLNQGPELDPELVHRQNDTSVFWYAMITLA